MKTNYTGLFRYRFDDTVRVQSGGYELHLSADEYRRRECQPPLENLRYSSDPNKFVPE